MTVKRLITDENFRVGCFFENYVTSVGCTAAMRHRALGVAHKYHRAITVTDLRNKINSSFPLRQSELKFLLKLPRRYFIQLLHEVANRVPTEPNHRRRKFEFEAFVFTDNPLVLVIVRRVFFAVATGFGSS